MQIWKRTVSFFLALTMVFTMLPVFALAEETEQPAQEETLTQEQPPQEETVTEEQTPQEEVTKTEDEREPVDEESENVQTEELLEESEEEFLSLELVEGLTDLAAAPMLLSADMHLSEAGKQFIKKNEGCVLTAYWDVNAYSIGYGHHGSDVYSGMTITQAQADAYFESDIVRFENAVNTMADENGVTLNQYQFDALTDFTYNEGAGVFVGHDRTIERYLRNGWTNYSETEWVEAFCLFDVGNSGLQARHTRQGKLFYSGNYGSVTENTSSRAAAPAAPTNFNATYLTDATAKLSWTAVSGATSYKVEYLNHKSTPSWEKDGSYVSGTSYTSTGLSGYSEWKFRVCAVNSSGTSAWTELTYNRTVKPVLSITNPSLPSKVEANSSFRLEGIISTSSGVITSVKASILSGGTAIMSCSDSPNTTTYDIHGKINDTFTFRSLNEGSYTYVVEATAVNNGLSTTTSLINQPFTVGNPSTSAPTTPSGSVDTSFWSIASGFIMPSKQQTVLDKIHWHLNNNSNVISAISAGKTVTFLFDGCSINLSGASSVFSGFNNSYSAVYPGYGSNTHRFSSSAVAIVISGNEVKYATRYCCTLPDNVRSDTETKGRAVLRDGTYSLATFNHLGYAAFQVRTAGNYQQGASNCIIRSTPTRTLLSDSTTSGVGIDVHATTYGYVDSSTRNSEGCLTVGSTVFINDKDYSNFVKTITGFTTVPYTSGKVKTEYSSGMSGKDAGILVLDRTEYLTALATIYGSDTASNGVSGSAIATGSDIANAITTNSRAWYQTLGLPSEVITAAKVQNVKVNVNGTTVDVTFDSAENATSYDVCLVRAPWGWEDIAYKQTVYSGSAHFEGVTPGHYDAFVVSRPGGSFDHQSEWIPFDTYAMYNLYVYGLLDGQNANNTKDYGYFNVNINGERYRTDVCDFNNHSFPAGSSYEITDIRTYSGHSYAGVAEGSLKGTLNGNTIVRLRMYTNPKATLDTQSTTLNLNGTNTKTIAYSYIGDTLNGYWLSFDNSNENVVSVEFNHDNKTFDVIGVNPGSAKISFSLVEYETNKVLDTAECTVTVTCSGTIEGGISWNIDSAGVLTISGAGAIPDYTEERAPWYEYASAVKSIRISSGITEIGWSAFLDCESVESVTIPNTVTKIAESAFVRCSSLKSITIPDSVKVIETGAFTLCTSMESAILSSGMTQIKDGTFFRCRKLKSVTIPESILSIGDSAFDECILLTDVYYGGSESQYKKIAISTYNEPLTDAQVHYAKEDSFTGICGNNLTWLLDKDGTLTISGTGAMANYNIGSFAPWYQYAEQIQKIVIEAGTTSVGNVAFYNLNNLTEVELPNTILTIGEWSFHKCMALTEIVLPNSVLTIQNFAFQESGLTQITLSNSLQSIGDQAILECRAFANPITIPASVTKIGRAAFAYGTITELHFLGDAPTFHSSAFTNNTLTCYYPEDNATWTSATKQNYGGFITWIAESTGAKPVEIQPAIPGAAQAGISLTAPEGGWKEGTNTFTVSCDKPCVVAVSYDGGQTYVRLTASDAAGGKSFTAENMTADTQLAVVVKGDASGDGKVNNVDAARAKAIILGKAEGDSLKALAMDANGDGKVNNVDVARVKASILGKSNLSW